MIPDYVSNTQLEKLQECPRKYWYMYGEGLRGMEQTHVSAVWSRSLVHPALAALWRRQAWGPEQWDEAVERFSHEIGADGLVASLSFYTRGLAERAVKLYLDEQWESDQETYVCAGVEQELLTRLGAGVPTYMSKPDVVLVDRETGEVWVLDWKTSTREKPELALPFHSQLVGQCVATGAVGFLVSKFHIRKPSKVEGRVKVEHERIQVRVTSDVKEEWLAETRERALARERFREAVRWPKIESACFGFGKQCPYLEACRAGAFGGNVVAGWQQAQARASERGIA